MMVRGGCTVEKIAALNFVGCKADAGSAFRGELIDCNLRAARSGAWKVWGLFGLAGDAQKDAAFWWGHLAMEYRAEDAFYRSGTRLWDSHMPPDAAGLGLTPMVRL